MILSAVRAAYAAGLCLLTVAADGSKRPDTPSGWRTFIERRPSVEEMRSFEFAHRAGFGVVGGAVSGGVDPWDFDDASTFDAFVAAAKACGLGPLVDRIRAGYEDTTPSVGRRWLARCAPGVEFADTILARRPGRKGDSKIKTLIEITTFSIVAPSDGTTHPSGRPYVRAAGDFDTIATYDPSERQALIELAKSFDEVPRRQAVPPKSKDSTDGKRPGDDFNARVTWEELLSGWTHVYDRGQTSYWRRPGKSHGISATTNHGGSDCLYVFSSSTEFDPDTSYTKFGAYATMNHAGDFSKAAFALAKQGYGSPNKPDNGQFVAPSTASPSTPRTLSEVEAAFARWIRDTDLVPTRAVLAAYVANRYQDGDPVWMMLVGGSGVGKTERLIPLAVMPDVILESSITGPAALLSGTGKKERAKDASGGVLRKFPNGNGMLLLKDFTSIIDMHRDARAEVLAALREVYDGRWDRSVGVDGGRTLTWVGRVGLIAGCTTAIDSAHSVISVMGTRFLHVRLHGDSDIAGSAFDHAGGETAMRSELREVVRGLLDHLPGQPYDKVEIRTPMLALASYVARARSPVDRDQRSEIRLVMDPEAPTRIVKMLTQLWRASGMLGLDKASAWELVRRVGLDSVPKLRRVVLDYLSTRSSSATTTEIADAVEHPTQTTRRALEDLTAHRAVTRLPGGQGRADRWELTSQMRDWLLQTLPVLSEDMPGTRVPVPVSSEDAHCSLPSDSSLTEAKITHDDNSGTVGRDGDEEDVPTWVTEPAEPDTSDPLGERDVVGAEQVDPCEHNGARSSEQTGNREAVDYR